MDPKQQEERLKAEILERVREIARLRREAEPAFPAAAGRWPDRARHRFPDRLASATMTQPTAIDGVLAKTIPYDWAPKHG